MCQCGCATFDPIAKLKAPNKKWYIIQIYSGCVDCNADAGVILYEMTNNELKEDWGIEDLPELSIPNIGLLIPVVGIDSFKRGLIEAFEVDLEELNESSFRNAVWYVRNKWKETINTRENI